MFLPPAYYLDTRRAKKAARRQQDAEKAAPATEVRQANRSPERSDHETLVNIRPSALASKPSEFSHKVPEGSGWSTPLESAIPAGDITGLRSDS